MLLSCLSHLKKGQLLVFGAWYLPYLLLENPADAVKQ